jgi:sugar lactone lactonase YvrE
LLSFGLNVNGGTGSGSNLYLNAPDGFFIDKAGNYYIADQENHRVVKVAANKSTYQIVAGGNGYGSALNQLYGPASIFVDDDYNLFIADRTNNRIVKWAPGATTGVVVAGSSASLAGNALNRLNNPNGVFVDKAGTIFIADKDNHRIVKWLKNANTGILVAGNGNPGGGATGLNSPWVIWVDAVGNIYVGDKDNQRVQMFPPNSNIGQTVAGGIGWGTTPSHITNPFGLFVDDYGNIFVSDHNNNRVLRFTKGSLTGEVVAGGNGQGALSNQTSTPNGIFVDPKGVLYVVERSNNRVNTFNPIIINRDTITASSRGNYYVKYTDYETRCSGNSAVISPIPKIFAKDTIRVFGVDTTLYADTTTYQTFLWSNGSTANKIRVTQTGIYTLNAKINATNCNREDKLFVYFGNSKIANAFSTICSDDSIILRANANNLGAKTQLVLDSAFVYGNGSINYFNTDSVNMYSWSYGSPGYVVLGKTDAKYGEISANVVSPNASIKASVVMAMQKEYPVNQPTYYAGSAALVFSIYTNGASIENSIPNSPYSPTILKSVTIPNLLTSVKHKIAMKHTYDDTLRCYLDGVEVLKMSTFNLKVKAGKFALRGDNTSYIFSKINFQKYDAKIRWNTGDTTFAIKKAPLATTGYSYLLTDNNYKFKDTATVNVLQSPIALIQPADSAFCSGDSLLLAANTGAGLTYQWKLNGINIAGATSANYFAKAMGNYTVQVKSANNCIKNSTSKYLVINSLPTSTITSIKNTFCIGDSVNLIGNTGTGLTYQWKLNGTNIVGATNANYYAKQSGQYTLEVTNAKGCKKLSIVKTMTAIDFPNATITAQSPITFCQGGTVTLSAPTGTALTYVWKRNNVNISGAITASYIANASGSYTVTITNSTGCAITSTPTVVTVNVLPIASITTLGSTTTCQGDSIKLRSNVEAGFTYQWKRNLVNIPNAIDSNYFAKQSGSYTVAITNANGCLKESTTKTVTINTLPNVNLNPFNAICLLNAPIQLTGGSPSGGVYSGIAVANGFFNPKSAGVGLHNIKYTYTDANGCINSSTRTIEVKQMPINRINKNGPIIFCKGSSVGLSVETEPGKTFTWYKDGLQMSNFGNSINVSNAGNYHAVVSANGCTINTDTVLITVQPLPVVSISPTGPTTICSGFNTGVKASGDQNLTYQWIKDNALISAAIDSNLIINATGNYRVIATNQNGCIDTSNAINITVLNYPAATVTASANTNFCIGDSVKLNANIGQNLSYQWFKNSTIITGATDSFYYAKLDGAYTVSVTLSNLCSTLSNAINITTNPLPISNITSLSGVDFCSGDTLELLGNIATNVTYQWYLNNNLLPAETNRKIKATQQGNYMLRVRDLNSCDKFSDNFPIQFYNAPYSQEVICAISVDSLTGKNVVVWEKTAGVRTEKFNIYREGAITGQYDLIGTLNYNQMSTFIDNTANPLSQSYRYKMAVIDSCGFESAKSPLHRTIHLSSNIGVNGEINLAWAPYEGVNYLTHRILRSINGAPFQTIASVSGATFSYTDLMPPAGPKYYRIEIDVPGGCSPTAMVQGYARILSNPVAISSNGVTNENYQASLINLYPNPTNGIVYVEGIINNNEVEVEIYDGIGKLLKIVKLNNDGPIDMSTFTPGVYTFKIEDRVQRIVKM